MVTELDTRIQATKNASVFLDKYDEGVWLSIQLPNGSANCTLSIEAAKEMIAALTRIVEASE